MIGSRYELGETEIQQEREETTGILPISGLGTGALEQALDLIRWLGYTGYLLQGRDATWSGIEDGMVEEEDLAAYVLARRRLLDGSVDGK